MTTIIRQSYIDKIEGQLSEICHLHDSASHQKMMTAALRIYIFVSF